MSRKFSLATAALSAILLASPALAQQPSGKDSTAAPTMAKTHGKHHGKKGHGAAAAKDTTKKDSTKSK